MISRFSILSDSREVVEGSGSSVHLVPHLALVAAASRAELATALRTIYLDLQGSAPFAFRGR